MSPIFALTKLSHEKAPYFKNKKDGLFIKKFITKKWPYEIYRGSIFQDFLLVLNSLS